MLEIDALRYSYDHNRMHYHLTVREGEIMALIGPSGGGKSTLLNLVAGFLEPDRGEIRWRGANFSRQTPALRPLTMLFQEHNLFPNLCVKANIAIGLDPGLRLDDRQEKEIASALRAVELERLAKRLPRELSGGQRQRVALARALVRNQPLLLLDEPFSALDPGLRKQMLKRLKNLQQTKGLTLLLISHNPEDIRPVADRVAYIENGRVKVCGKPAYIFDHPLLQAYLGKSC